MNKTFRILLAIGVFTAILAIGLNGAAWADKLNVGVQAPAAHVADQGLAAGARQPGTVAIATADPTNRWPTYHCGQLRDGLRNDCARRSCLHCLSSPSKRTAASTTRQAS